MEAQAYDLGKQAFEAGIRVPVEDGKLQCLLGKCSEKMPLLAAWYRGWTVASLEEVKPCTKLKKS
jgi:hypothetical protein